MTPHPFKRRHSACGRRGSPATSAADAEVGRDEGDVVALVDAWRRRYPERGDADLPPRPVEQRPAVVWAPHPQAYGFGGVDLVRVEDEVLADAPGAVAALRVVAPDAGPVGGPVAGLVGEEAIGPHGARVAVGRPVELLAQPERAKPVPRADDVDPRDDRLVERAQVIDGGRARG